MDLYSESVSYWLSSDFFPVLGSTWLFQCDVDPGVGYRLWEPSHQRPGPLSGSPALRSALMNRS